MSLLSTGAAPNRAVKDGLYVPVPAGGGAVAERLIARVDLQPASSHLVVGGIGTGKTTQLLIAEQQLSTLPDVLPVYIDIGAQHDLTQLRPGVLIVIAGVALGRYMSEHQLDVERKTREEFKKWAEGYTVWIDDDEDPADYDDGPSGRPVSIRGVVVPPDPPLDHLNLGRLRALIKHTD